MIDPVKQASSIYRTNEDWYTLDQFRREHGGYLTNIPASPSPAPSPDPQQERSAFAHLARKAAQALALVLNEMLLLQSITESFQATTAASPLQARKAWLSHTGKATAQVVHGATLAAYSLEIRQPATIQRNEGAFLPAYQRAEVAAGSHRFTITVNGHIRALSLYIPEDLTNANLIYRMRQAINEAKISIVAHIEMKQEADEEMIRLIVCSRHTGSSQAFSIADEAGSLIAATGVASRVQKAEQALYRLGDGQEESSPSNELQLDQGRVTVHLQAAGALEITVVVDDEAVLARFGELLHTYNRLLDLLEELNGILDFTIRQELQAAIPAPLPHVLELSVHSQGKLEVKEEDFQMQLQQQFLVVSEALIGPAGLVTAMDQALKKWLNCPVSDMLGDPYACFRPLFHYSYMQGSHPPTKACLPLPLSGYLMNESY